MKDYFKKNFASDLKAGFITAIVALPLAIAFAIASGVAPIMGLYTAVIAGILAASFGGSKFSVTGPTGAMTVIILATVSKFGLEGLLLAGFLAGIIQVLFGVFRLGRVVKYIPLPVIVGFTAGIGAIIFIGQIGNALGLILEPKVHVWEIFKEIFSNIGNINLVAVGIMTLTVLTLVFLPKVFSKSKFTKNIPVSIVALIILTAGVYFFALKVPLVGNIPSGLPKLNILNFNFELFRNVLPSAFTIAMLGAIEALLCAVVCDAMTNTKHNSDRELIGQGVANLVLPFFGAIPSTAAIARSAVNIREGARTKISVIIHSVILLLVILLLVPVASHIPKAFLAGILFVVSFRMIDLKEFKTIIRISKSESLVLFATFVLTIATDLVFAVQIGMLFAIFLLFVKLTKIVNIKNMEEYDGSEFNEMIEKNEKLKGKVAIYTIHGPFFFGAMNVFENKINEHMHISRPCIIIRMKHVPFVDSTSLTRLVDFLKDRKKLKSRVIFTEFWPGVKEDLFKHGEFKELVGKEDLFKTVQDALKSLEKDV